MRRKKKVYGNNPSLSARDGAIVLVIIAVVGWLIYNHKSSSQSSDSKPVHVKGYYRKDGTYVHSHNRSR